MTNRTSSTNRIIGIIRDTSVDTIFNTMVNSMPGRLKKTISLSWFMISILLIFCFTGTLILTVVTDSIAAQESQSAESVGVVPEDNKTPSIDMLLSIAELRKGIQKRIDVKRAALAMTTSESEKESLKLDLANLDKQLSDASTDFESVATGVDISLFTQKKTETFNWQSELLSLVEPGIKELKHLTLKARQKTKLKEEIGYYNSLIPVADQAISNIRTLIEKSPDRELQSYIRNLVPEWTGIREQLGNKMKVASMQLEKMEREEESLIESSRAGIKNFFRTRGLYLFLALMACVGVVIILRLLYVAMKRSIPDYRAEYRPFYIRVIDLLFKLASVVMTAAVLLFVFYSAEDWVLLSLTIIFFMGLAWTIKHSIPVLWQQSRLMLNIGAVREGERMIYDGVPWIVKTINVFCILENPWLEISIRIPIEELSGKVSREVKHGEPWFPCRKNDWITLSDGTTGKAVSISHELVELVQHGGSRKTYQTQDFISLNPLNLSSGFRISVVFGIGYSHQREATSSIPSAMQTHIMKQIYHERLSDSLVSLKVEFSEAGASSLDLVIIADFNGDMAQQFSRISRDIQKWCVEACSANGWDIPFPQLTVHKG